jgi:hypothetical protein
MSVPVNRNTHLHHLNGSIVAAFVVAALAYAAAPAFAQAHHARLSADLADHLSAGSQAIRVIVHGTRAEVDALAARYNLTVARYMRSGAVLLVNAGQLAAIRQDGSQDHLSGDIPIRSSVDEADVASVGADQVWDGSDEVVIRHDFRVAPPSNLDRRAASSLALSVSCEKHLKKRGPFHLPGLAGLWPRCVR